MTLAILTRFIPLYDSEMNAASSLETDCAALPFEVYMNLSAWVVASSFGSARLGKGHCVFQRGYRLSVTVTSFTGSAGVEQPQLEQDILGRRLVHSEVLCLRIQNASESRW